MALVAQRMGRRGLLRAGAVTGIAAAVAGTGLARGTAMAQEASPVASPVAALPSGFSGVVDLTHTWGPEFPMFPGAKQAEFQTLVTVEANGFFKMQLTLDEHTGTHMDAPRHFVTDGMSADELPVERFIAPLVVIDVSERAASDPDTQGMVDDLTAWESANGPIPDGAFVALYSGWEARLADPASYLNMDASDVMHFPGWHPDAAAFLVNERNITGAGVDTISLDFGASTDFGAHLTFLPAGKYGLENVANLANVPPAGATVIVGGPKHRGASGGPSRVLALV
jgi:kynurenine formamidase